MSTLTWHYSNVTLLCMCVHGKDGTCVQITLHGTEDMNCSFLSVTWHPTHTAISVDLSIIKLLGHKR